MRSCPAPAATGELLPTSLDYLRLQAARSSDSAGIVFEDRLVSYGEFSVTVETLAAALARRGLGAGHHIALLSGNNPTTLAMYYAIWGIGAVAIPIAVRSTAEEVAGLLEHSRSNALLCDAERVEVARAAGRAARVEVMCTPSPQPSPRGRGGRIVSPQPAFRGGGDLRILAKGNKWKEARPRSPRPRDLASIAYTSGTTGSPKGVMVTHANYLWATASCSQARSDRAETVGAVVSPISHTPVLVSHVLCRIFLGSTIVLFPRFDTGAILDGVERYGITDLSLIGSMVFDIVGMKRVPDGVRRSLRKVAMGGAPTPMPAKRALAAIFDQAEIIEAYGMSEATDSVTMTRGTSIFDREGTTGRPNPHITVRVKLGDGSLAPPGEEGEVVVAGPTVMHGYYRNRDATAQALRDGWLHTGDLGRQDADGYLYITGRLKDLIITGGENVAPREVEDALRLHPDVADVAVIGTPHPRWGEQVTAVVVPRPGSNFDAASLTEFAGRHLSGFKKPRRIELVDEIPRNATRKVLVNALKKRFS